MAFDGDTHADTQPPRKRGATRIGLLLTLLGAAILIGPLLYTMYADPSGEKSGVLIIGLPLFLFIAALFLAFGLTVLFSQVVDYGAVGAGKVKILGLEMPMEFQGAAMVLFLLLLGMGTSIKLFDLMSLNESWSQWSQLRQQVNEQESDISTLNAQLAAQETEHITEMTSERDIYTAELESLRTQVAGLQGRFETSRDGADRLREILIAQTKTASHQMMIRFKCRDLDDPRRVNWTGTGSARRGNLLSHGAPISGENATDLPSQRLNQFILTGERQMTYTITNVDDRTNRRRKVISVSFHIENENLVATIWPEELSLWDLCNPENDPLRTAGASDGQAPAIPVSSWQQELESEGNGL